MEAIDRIVYSNDWITGIVLLSLVLLVIARNRFYNRFIAFIILPFNNKYIMLFNKKGRLVSEFHVLLSVVQCLNLSLFLYLTVSVWHWHSRAEGPLNFGLILGGILIFSIVKLGMQLLAGYIFNLEKMTHIFLFNKGSYLNFSALILFLFNLLLAYLAPESKPIVFIAFSLVVLTNLIGWGELLNSNLKYVTTHIFYFILYLCALEIAPLVIVPYVLNA